MNEMIAWELGLASSPSQHRSLYNGAKARRKLKAWLADSKQQKRGDDGYLSEESPALGVRDHGLLTDPALCDAKPRVIGPLGHCHFARALAIIFAVNRNSRRLPRINCESRVNAYYFFHRVNRDVQEKKREATMMNLCLSWLRWHQHSVP